MKIKTKKKAKKISSLKQANLLDNTKVKKIKR